MNVRPYPLPPDEEDRLKELASYNILGSAPERDFDHLVELACRIFRVPVALVSLVARETQFLKARVGIDACDTSRDVSFCAHALMDRQVLYVPDATLDSRFAANPLVLGPPNIRFYAGAPLISPSGHALGSLCIIDDKPRHDFTETDALTLANMADLIVDRLEVRRLDLQRRIHEEQLEHLAHFDALTGLPNRVALWQKLDSALTSEGCATVLLIDLDGFKNINDTLGHLYGDEVLRCMASRIRAAVPEAEFVARPSGDEFVVVIGDCGDPLIADRLSQAVVDEIAEPCEVQGRSIQLGVSIGVAIAPQHGTTPEEVLTSADLALYRAKAEGRGRAELFTPMLRQAVLTRRSCETQLTEALKNKEFELVYQPQVRLSDCVLGGAEALLRWRHPQRGLLAPGAFLPVLEEMHIASDVGAWVLHTACRQVAEWRAQGADLCVAVNLFGAQFRGNSLVGVVEDAVSASGLPADRLELEITENIILRHEDAMKDALTRLRSQDVGIAFDDYGTGFASLSQLKRFPLTKLKIDKSFVHGLCTDHMDAAVVDAVLSLGRSFGFDVVAEGVEQLAQHDRLAASGCSWGQGFLYGRPLSAEAFSQRLSEWCKVA